MKQVFSQLMERRIWLKTENLRIVQYKAGHKHIGSTERFKSGDVEELKREVLKN